MEIKSASYKNRVFRWTEYHCEYNGYGDTLVHWSISQFVIYIMVRIIFSITLIIAFVLVGLGVLFNLINIIWG